MDRIDEIMGTRVLPDLIEADVQSGDRTMVTAALERLAERAEVIRTPLAEGLLARSEALTSTGAHAESQFQRALELMAGRHLAPELARTQLLFGEWLRRLGRRREAREHLQAAFEHFNVNGMVVLAKRARREIEATGERARKRSYETQDDLTPQEAQVAHMAAEGARNAEIAARMFISPATVEYHMSKVYRKLGVDSRAKLVRLMLLASADDREGGLTA